MEETTAGVVLRMLMAQLAAFEALLLFASAGHKLIAWSYMRTVVRQFANMPEALASPALALAALLEGSAAVLFLSSERRASGGLLAALLWVVYLGLVVRAILQERRDIDCGCGFGTSTAHRPLGWFQVSRNAVLIAVAVMISAVSVSGDGAPIEGAHALAAAALLALYGALDQVMGLRPLRRGEVV